jgi:hypothetical protein
MSLLPLGLLSQGGGAAALDGFEPISSTVLTGTQASITISSIPATYSALQLRIVARSNTSVTFDDMILRFNGDSTSVYSWKTLDTNGGTTSQQAVSETSIRLFGIGGANLTTSAFGAMTMDIIGYRNTNMRTLVRGFGGAFSFQSNFTGNSSVFNGLWNPTTTVTSLSVAPRSGGSFIAGTRVSLYGVL